MRRAKFGKHRLLPLHSSAVNAVTAYRRLRDDTFPQPVSPALLVSQTGTRLLHFNVGQTFARLARQAGLAPRSPRCRPRPHDYADIVVMPIFVGRCCWQADYRLGVGITIAL